MVVLKASSLYCMQMRIHVVSVCGDGWPEPCTWITQRATGRQPPPAPEPNQTWTMVRLLKPAFIIIGTLSTLSFPLNQTLLLLFCSPNTWHVYNC